MTDFGGKTSIFSHPVYLFLRKFSLQDSRGGSDVSYLLTLIRRLIAVCLFSLKGVLDEYQIGMVGDVWAPCPALFEHLRDWRPSRVR
ncbi:hypothetical protein SEES3845_026210 (plasmid) [Salmonella enterica subsp. enterica serovar Senftenberg str. ATCC 43845]|nr:hypothetical protein SEES3845_026210 [Salmonella enterica subsp. enterica serovar Senftenberg str. ATCC 43845]